jgi:hypothetical protein
VEVYAQPHRQRCASRGKYAWGVGQFISCFLVWVCVAKQKSFQQFCDMSFPFISSSLHRDQPSRRKSHPLLFLLDTRYFFHAFILSALNNDLDFF